eukprot:CAMPEP_0204833924 /NCGR_PEP_ID=MMETSP1346-20131115/18224_1 /ASSEMBLY_ACC=CAM_ASM_000771 /TAXON_ID=215587 /ORGANISM="Aplanochytrium stocchinoi, Strain GSBS06" /LENGTH=44 /DNA_ID= /DNA_START= /DNA_END= /DNA_ORIENTATION=
MTAEQKREGDELDTSNEAMFEILKELVSIPSVSAGSKLREDCWK